eukprot:TRINITY_DN13146_c0_g1_i1.p2 TRINITY_DN13146_c0_g1~~TRINITY_DN13146_c0_g1_i1.p2  ORF type:complete len:108 (-),score=1.08 TRINITY_DN13146_c0_g1_i1:728-1051(-)
MLCPPHVQAELNPPGSESGSGSAGVSFSSSRRESAVAALRHRAGLLSGLSSVGSWRIQTSFVTVWGSWSKSATTFAVSALSSTSWSTRSLQQLMRIPFKASLPVCSQ